MRLSLKMVVLSAVVAIAGLPVAAIAERTFVPLDQEWHFVQANVDGASASEFDDAKWDSVTVPHVFPLTGPANRREVYRGEAWYRRRFDAPAAWKGRRVFLRFNAAAMTSETFLNGERLGEHRGGFSAFTYEITDQLKIGVPNQLSVRVDNRWNNDVAPLESSLLYGGIYRDVSLVVTDPINITPMDYSSPGVYLTQHDVSAEAATVDVKTRISNGVSTDRPIVVRLTVFDQAGKTIVTKTDPATAAAGQTVAVVQTIKFDRPHLWNGVADPYLYSARIELLDADKVIDTVIQPLGLRSFSVKANGGFVLNGVARQLHGVCLHQDYGTLGWAVAPAQEQESLGILREMGTDSIRLVHYPHSQSALDLYDRTGMIIWSELAQFRLVGSGEAYKENVRQQLTEMIRQNYNHPSIVTWSLYNELASSVNAVASPIVKDLNELAHQEDPTRLTVAAGSGDTIWNSRAITATPDLIGDNVYDGWYSGAPNDLAKDIDRHNALYNKRGLCISEYGGGAKIGDHQQNLKTGDVQPRGPFQPEEWQATVHEGNYRGIKNSPAVWGSFVWLSFDSGGTPRANGSIEGGNIKGLVTQDRKHRKDAFFFYQANWTAKPMLYLTSRRHVTRTEAVTPIKIYSNEPRVALSVNGRDCGEQTPDDLHVFNWKHITLQPGQNVIKITTPSGLEDTATWTLVPGH